MSLPWIPPYRRSVLSRAVARWRAGNYNAALDALVDESGNGLHARLGSAVGADTNDPLRLSYAGKYIYFPASASNGISAPDSVGLSITGDIHIRRRVALDDWTPAGDQTLCAKRSGAGQFSWQFDIKLTTGLLYFYISTDGTSALANISSVAPTVADGATLYVGVYRVAATGVTTFETSSDGVTWTQLGTTVNAGAGAIFDSTSPIEIGATLGNTANRMLGKDYYTEIRSGYNGTIVGSLDASKLAEPYATYTDPQGNVWTLSRSASGRKLCVVDRDLLLLGTDDYLEVVHHPLLVLQPGFTVVVAARVWGNAAAAMAFISKRGGAGYLSFEINGTKTSYFEINNGATNIGSTAGAYVDGTAFIEGFVVGATAATKFINGTLGGPSALNAGPWDAGTVLRIGQWASSYYLSGEIMGAAIFREALTAADLTRLKREMLP